MKTTMTSSAVCGGMLAAAVGLGACARDGGVVAKTAAAYGSAGAASRADASLSQPARAPTARSSMSPAPHAPPSAESMHSEAPGASGRPGLGTEWGETRYSHVSHSSFDRADPYRPSQVVSLYYNDREGARAMARYADYREMSEAVLDVPALGIHVALNDEGGRPLPAFYAGGRTYAIGEAGQRYTVVVSNETGVRVEAVASVDGLDVIDGKLASPSKRGYLVPAFGSVAIDGFRQSNDHVAAFRFGSVRDSYAARTGTDRNVGIVGVALFTPRNAPAWRWTDREIERRLDADPFPGSYASPPPRRW